MKTTLTKCEKCDFTRLDYEIKNVNECLYCYGKNKKFSKTQMNAMINFYKRINELGGKVIGEYKRAIDPIHCKCKDGHECYPLPTNIQRGQGMCLICAGQDPETAKQNFYKRIKELGGEVIGKYVNTNTRVQCKCKNGHDCYPLPTNIQRGQGMCIICSGHDPKTAKHNFYNNIKKLGGEVIGEYIDNNTSVYCKCKNGHDCNPLPANIQRGRGMCLICAGQDPETAKQNFYKRIKELGGEVIGEYINNNTPVECKCKNEHICNPSPGSIRSGNGMCKICAGTDPETAKQNFYNNIEELGGKVIGEYKRAIDPIQCICKNGHDCYPYPSHIQRGQGMCIICAGQDPETAKQNFYKRIKELGGEVIGEYVNNNTPVECKCKNEHICNPRPSDVQRGQGMCNKCITNGYSKVAIKWIESISKNIQHAENIGEYCIQNTKYKVDGYDEKTNTIYEFHGCFWHGCVKCYTDREEMNPISKKTYEELFKKTIERIEIFKSLGYNVVEKWECELKI